MNQIIDQNVNSCTIQLINKIKSTYDIYIHKETAHYLSSVQIKREKTDYEYIRISTFYFNKSVDILLIHSYKYNNQYKIFHLEANNCYIRSANENDNNFIKSFYTDKIGYNTYMYSYYQIDEQNYYTFDKAIKNISLQDYITTLEENIAYFLQTKQVLADCQPTLYAQKIIFQNHIPLNKYNNKIVRKIYNSEELNANLYVIAEDFFFTTTEHLLYLFNELIEKFPFLKLFETKYNEIVNIITQYYINKYTQLLTKSEKLIHSQTLWDYAINENEYICSISLKDYKSLEILEHGIQIEKDIIIPNQNIPFQSIYSCFDCEAGGWCRISLEKGYSGYDTLWEFNKLKK